MSIFDSLQVAVLGMSVVFIVLVALSLVVKVQSLLLSFVTKSKTITLENMGTDNENNLAGIDNSSSWGELKLVGIDEKTAAMVMAIVSDESKIPLSDLQFKSIRALD